ncbi:hypothetical protein HS088_TW13G01059 [Tripterygium wilfordii]|uniref:Uncharacterized protein n=1 Tax=Tripterygium wilfordii TaxID=458696 RepID=A0A7J7CVV6_TRIWF|nr:uncharacterized protein LOC120013187 [Tripterygium wilfordii]KAF5738164.1 hypothetical protein HS088_TW13G01059 [Tripterygium wilfordii]
MYLSNGAKTHNVKGAHGFKTPLEKQESKIGNCLTHRYLRQKPGSGWSKFALLIIKDSKMLLILPTSIALTTLQYHGPNLRSRTRLHKPLKVSAMANESSDGSGGNGVIEKAAIAGGLVSTPVIAWSLYTLKTTGCGLPPGPGGSVGALEGVSYLVVVGILGWSIYTKTKTGSGLPNGPFGLLGAVEGLSYLSLLAILVVFGLQFLEQGSIPGPLPSDQCFG